MSDPALSQTLAIPVEGVWEGLSIECVTFDAAGRPKRRRLRSLSSMLQPLPSRADHVLATANGTTGY